MRRAEVTTRIKYDTEESEPTEGGRRELDVFCRDDGRGGGRGGSHVVAETRL